MNVSCEYCKKQFAVTPSRLKAKTVCCSRECAALMKKAENNCICEYCGKKFHLKPYRLSKAKYNYCTKDCFNSDKSNKFSGENNHQYGLKGRLNSSWKSDSRISSYGYRLIRCLTHPFRNSDDFVFEHRLIAEKYLLTSECTVEIDGVKYLSSDYVVHHKDFNKRNNEVDNLEIMKKEDHITLHNIRANRKRNKLGQYI